MCCKSSQAPILLESLKEEEIVIDELEAKQLQESTDEFAAKEMQDPTDELEAKQLQESIDALDSQLKKVELDSNLKPRLIVDRHREGNNPDHKMNPLSDLPGGEFSVFTNGVMYPNIHYPRAYVKAILANNPQQKVQVFSVDNEGKETQRTTRSSGKPQSDSQPLPWSHRYKRDLSIVKLVIVSARGSRSA